MSNFLKYFGTVVLLIGIAILAISAVTGTVTNTILMVGLTVVILGYVAHILLGRRLR